MKRRLSTGLPGSLTTSMMSPLRPDTRLSLCPYCTFRPPLMMPVCGSNRLTIFSLAGTVSPWETRRSVCAITCRPQPAGGFDPAHAGFLFDSTCCRSWTDTKYRVKSHDGLKGVTYYAPFANSFSALAGDIRRGDTHEIVRIDHKTMIERMAGYFGHPEAKSLPSEGIGPLERGTPTNIYLSVKS